VGSAVSCRDASQVSAGQILALVGILFLALGLRLEDVQQPLVDFFSWREASTAMMADNLPANGWNPLWPEVSWTGDQPGYQGREFQTLTIAAAILDAIFGWRDWHGRLVAALCGVVSTFALFRLVSLLRGPGEGLLAGAVYAVLPGAILIDRSYLPDPAMLALALVSLCLLAEGMARGSARWLVAAWAMGSLALLAKLPALAAVPASIYLVLSSTSSDRRQSYALQLCAAVAAAGTLVAAYYLWAIHLGRAYPPFHIAGDGWIWEEGFAKFWKEGFYLNTLRWHVETWLWTPAVIVLAVAGFFASFDRRRGSSKLDAPWFFHIWLAGCALFYVAAALELRGNPWNLHIFNPAAAAFTAAGIALIVNAVKSGFASGRLLAVLAMVFTVLATGRAGVDRIKHDELGTLDYALGSRLAELSREGDLVIASGTYAGSAVAIFYSRRRGWLFPPPEEADQRGFHIYEDDLPAIEVLDGLVSRGAKLFGFVKSGQDWSEPNKQFIEHYSELIAHLRERARTAHEDDSIAIFDLAPLAKQAVQEKHGFQAPAVAASIAARLPPHP